MQSACFIYLFIQSQCATMTTFASLDRV